ncbi:MAG: hypothetical protein V1794_05455, partial [Candidatus Glassbacteria bacterium]
VCGFTPLRGAGPESGTEGLAAYSHLHGLLPRLGFFIGHETKVPVDFAEIIACIAPRPVLVVAPTLDRDAVISEVKAAVAAAGRVYGLLGAGEKLSLSTPTDYSRFDETRQGEVADWLKKTAGR